MGARTTKRRDDQAIVPLPADADRRGQGSPQISAMTSVPNSVGKPIRNCAKIR